MGILCDLFVADPVDAPHYADESDDYKWAQEMESVPLGGLTQLEFELLWALMEGRPWDPETHALMHIGEESDETWLFRFPTTFVQLLAALPESRVPAVAQQWAQTEEMGGGNSEDVEGLISTLTELASKASASNRGLFLWGSL
jgi:hypothetical protein